MRRLFTRGTERSRGGAPSHAARERRSRPRADRADLVVADVPLAVGKRLELGERLRELGAPEIVPERARLGREARVARELAEDDLGADRVSDEGRVDALEVEAVL